MVVRILSHFSPSQKPLKKNHVFNHADRPVWNLGPVKEVRICGFVGSVRVVAPWGTLESRVQIPVRSLMQWGFGKSLPLLKPLFPSLHKWGHGLCCGLQGFCQLPESKSSWRAKNLSLPWDQLLELNSSISTVEVSHKGSLRRKHLQNELLLWNLISWVSWEVVFCLALWITCMHLCEQVIVLLPFIGSKLGKII